jgi:hypothetical protein
MLAPATNTLIPLTAPPARPIRVDDVELAPS